MPAYKFEALDADGKTQTGLLDGDNAKAVRTLLRARALVPLDVQPVAETRANGSPAVLARRVFNATTLSIWTRQLAGLVGAGLPLERALTALADEAEDPKQGELLAHLRAEVNAGSTFARALASARANAEPALTSALSWLMSSRWRVSSLSSASAVSARSMGRPEPTRPASWRVHTASAVALNTRRAKRLPSCAPCCCTISRDSGVRPWARTAARAARGLSASIRPLV